MPLGVGDAFSARYYSAAIAVGAEGRWLLIDCPHPIRKMLREASLSSGLELDVGSFAGIALSHLHADHCSGLEGFGYFAHFVLGRRTPILAHPDVAAELWSGHLQAGMRQLQDAAGKRVSRTFSDYFELIELSEERVVHFGPFEIECRKTNHHIPTTAFRIGAAGRRLAYSADTGFDPDLIAWLAEADLIIHETNRGIHTPCEKLSALPGGLRSRIRLIHYPDDFAPSDCAPEPLEQGHLYSV